MISPKNKVCAIVVTHNRLQLLKECINAIKNQTYSCDIFVVNNNSSDYTELFLISENINHVKTVSNIGGAGGFNLAIKKTINYEFLWMMDDDCIPEVDALEKLMDADFLLKNKYGFLCSKVLWVDGSINKMNEIHYIDSAQRYKNIYKVRQATFVSFFIKTDVIKKCGLPIKEFFIWGDDIEYSRRIAVVNNFDSYYVNESVVIHKSKTNTGSKIAFDSADNINRYYYAYRNEFFLYKKEGLKGILYYICKCLYNCARVLLFSKDNKSKRINVLLKGFIDGFSFKPEIEYL